MCDVIFEEKTIIGYYKQTKRAVSVFGEKQNKYIIVKTTPTLILNKEVKNCSAV